MSEREVARRSAGNAIRAAHQAAEEAPAERLRGLKLDINWAALLFEVAKIVLREMAESLTKEEKRETVPAVRKGRKRK